MHGVPFSAVNVLEDEQLRQDIKEYSDWPTIPQIYVGKLDLSIFNYKLEKNIYWFIDFHRELIGGSDILVELHQNGSLDKEFEKVGLKSKLSAEKEESKA